MAKGSEVNRQLSGDEVEVEKSLLLLCSDGGKFRCFHSFSALKTFCCSQWEVWRRPPTFYHHRTGPNLLLGPGAAGLKSDCRTCSFNWFRMREDQPEHEGITEG